MKLFQRVLLAFAVLVAVTFPPGSASAAEAATAGGAQVLPTDDLKLWYAKPAEKWAEALPIGSGRLGAMVFGGTAEERVQYNEDTLWTGKPHDYVHKGAAEALPEIRKLVAAGTKESVKAAEDMVRAKFLSIPLRQRAYQPFGDLMFSFPGHDKATDYRRELDLDAAVARTTYTLDGVRYERRAIASYPDGVIAIRITADKPGKVSFTLKHTSPHAVSRVKLLGTDTLVLAGQVQDPKVFMYSQVGKDAPKKPEGAPPDPVQTDGLKFESRARVLADGGKVSATDAAGAGIVVENADSATVILAAATSFKSYKDISGDPATKCEATLALAGRKTFDALLAAHTADHQNLFRRVGLNLGATDRGKLPTDERLKAVSKDGIASDPQLLVLHFQFGRYCLIASSRPGTQAANLQGVWNDLLDPPWESKYTTNINFEMNYWPAEVTNLSECHEPLFDLTEEVAEAGKAVAREHYRASGWVLHHNTDLWRGTAPINNIDGQWPTGGAWLCYHLWEHYLYTGDREFLARRALPVMKGACEFFLDFLVVDPKTGWLISTPSHSPEQGGTVPGPAMDHQLIRALFDTTIEACRITGTEQALASNLALVRARLAPDQVGKHGQLMEWLTDIDVPNNNHRHMSPLWCLFPGAQYTPADADPKLYEAAKLLLKWRGDGSTGWSYAWRAPLQARVGDGDAALGQLNGLIAKRTLPNLFDLCGPFQIDGNFGATAAVAEMLLQSHVRTSNDPDANYVVQLLPALPAAWPKGSVTGLRARGGFEVDITWDAGKVTRAVVRSTLGRPCKVRVGERVIDLQTEKGKQYVLEGGALRGEPVPAAAKLNDGATPPGGAGVSPASLNEEEARAGRPRHPGGGGLVSSEFIYEAAPFPSVHASTIAELPDGKGFVAAFFGGERERAPDVGIWVARLADGDGAKWSAPVEVVSSRQADGSRLPNWNPVLFQSKDGPLLLFYKVGPSPQTWWGMLTTSTDGGQTWSTPRRLPEGILGPIKNKPVQLADGSLLCPTSTEAADRPSDAADRGWRVHFERTPDLGQTWAKVAPPAGDKPVDAIQPSVLFHGGSVLQAIGRTRAGRVFETWSRDGGATWSPIALTELPNPNSGTDAVTLKDGRHLLVYNHNAAAKGRTPLNVAIAPDGKRWHAALVLESEPGEYSYPAVIEDAEGRVHVTYTWKRERVKHVVIDPAKLSPGREIVGGVWPAGPPPARAG